MCTQVAHDILKNEHILDKCVINNVCCAYYIQVMQDTKPALLLSKVVMYAEPGAQTA